MSIDAWQTLHVTSEPDGRETYSIVDLSEALTTNAGVRDEGSASEQDNTRIFI